MVQVKYERDIRAVPIAWPLAVHNYSLIQRYRHHHQGMRKQVYSQKEIMGEREQFGVMLHVARSTYIRDYVRTLHVTYPNYQRI